MPNLDQRLAAAQTTLKATGQSHLLNFYDDLNERARDSLLSQIESQDWHRLSELIQSHVLNTPDMHLPTNLQPAPYFPTEPTPELAEQYQQAEQLGEQLIRDGKVAPFTVAGGQGTRLGWDGPKGTFPATPITGKPLFQVFAEYLRKVEMKYDTKLTWYIMTSPINDAPTRSFFDEHNHFGFAKDRIVFFEQGTIPSFSLDGKALLESPEKLATNPDGHGGSLLALHKSGALNRMKKDGVEQISYFQIDNPLVKCIDPLFIGLHAQANAQMSSKMVKKVSPEEKVGVFCLADNRIQIIEYSDLFNMPGEPHKKTDNQGNLLYIGGSIAIHIINVNFVAKLNEGRFALPWHRADKKVPHIDPDTGKKVSPSSPNAVKLESFVFDALASCDSSILLQTLRNEEFAPIKNADGPDSPATSRKLQSDRACRWLDAAGVTVSRRQDGTFDTLIELSPLTAISVSDIKTASDELPNRIEANERVTI